ncbi:hypothetical protein evm_002629 [Chilo suppressalis]|nr:hypothetical protein evm_002629 [Chilo suppressalis]
MPNPTTKSHEPRAPIKVHSLITKPQVAVEKLLHINPEAPPATYKMADLRNESDALADAPTKRIGGKEMVVYANIKLSNILGPNKESCHTVPNL